MTSNFVKSIKRWFTGDQTRTLRSTPRVATKARLVLEDLEARLALATLHVGSHEPYTTIQSAINAANPGDTIQIDPGTYVANGSTVVSGSAVGEAGQEIAQLVINKPLTIIGPNPTYDPTSSLPAANTQAVIVPSMSDANPYDTTAVIVVLIESSNVTIEGVTVDGHNSSLASHYSDPGTNTFGFGPTNPHVGHVTANSATPIDASEDIASYSNVSNITLQSDIVENAGFIGVDFNNSPDYSGGATTGNTITNNLIQNISDAYGFGDAVNLYDNFYANVTHNVIINAFTGIQVGNFTQANPDGTAYASLSNNQINAGAAGIFYNLSSAAATPFAVQGDNITAVNNPAYTTWQGVFAAIAGSENVNFAGNTINGSGANSATMTAGYEMWNSPNSTITGGTVSGVDDGVWANSFEGNDSPGGATSVTLNGVSINASQIGIYVEDSSQYHGNTPVPVSATIEGTTSVTVGASGIGLEVDGADASASVAANATLTTQSAVVKHSGTLDIYGTLVAPSTTGTIVAEPGGLIVGAGITVGVGSRAGQLYIVDGSSSNDQVQVNPVGTSNTGTSGVKVQTKLNGVNTQTTYDQSFSTIYIVMQGGNENIQFASTLNIGAVVTAGNGNDNIQLGNGNNTITLGNGNNNVQAGTGMNAVLAGSGNNIVQLGNGPPPPAPSRSHRAAGCAPPAPPTVGPNTVTLGNGNNNVQIGNGSNQTILVGNGNDNVQLGKGSGDDVTIGTGNDNVQIGKGNDNTVTEQGPDMGHDNIKLGRGSNNTIG